MCCYLLKRATILVGLLFLLFALFPATGEASLSVDPLTIELEATSGESDSTTLNLRNTGEEELEVNVQLVDWRRTPSGGLQFLPSETNERSCAEWLFYSPTSLTIPPGERRQVSVEIEVPEDVMGDHWAMFLVTQTLEETEGKEPLTARFTVNYAIKILQSDPYTDQKNAKITNIKLTKKDPLSLTVTYENSGPTHLQTSGTVEIRDIQGETIREYGIEVFPTLPGEEHKIEVTDNKNPDPLEPGTYYAVVVMDYGGDQLIQGGLPIEIPKNTEESTA